MAVVAEQWGMDAQQWDMSNTSSPGMGIAQPVQNAVPNFGSNISQGCAGAMELKRLFLNLSPDEQRCLWASDLLNRTTEGDAAACIPLVLNRLVNFPSASLVLGMHVLSELLRLHPNVLIQCLEPKHIYDFFHTSVDDRQAATFLHSFLCSKDANGMDVREEAGKIKRLILRRMKHLKNPDLRRAPASPLRSLLCRVWLDIPTTRSDSHLISQCCARWIADIQSPLADKYPCLGLIKEEVDKKTRAEGEAWIVTLILEQVCRDPATHSPDLQQILWLLDDAPSATGLRPLLDKLGEERGRLVTLWVCLCLWVPQPGPDFLPPRQVPPIHALLRSMLTAFSQFPKPEDLCRSCLSSLAAIAAAGRDSWSQTASSATILLSTLYRDGPLLAGDVWLPMVPVLQSLSHNYEPAAHLLSQLGEMAGASPQEQYAVAFDTVQPPFDAHTMQPPMQPPLYGGQHMGGPPQQQQQQFAFAGGAGNPNTLLAGFK